MTKNILVLTGSPRKDGNTEKLADAFIAGANNAGHTTVKYSTADKNIKGCIDCKTCFQNGSACSVPDDFQTFAPILEKADALALVTPMYSFSFPAQLKAFMDKFYSYLISNTPLKIKECALLVCGGGKEEYKYDGLVKSYKLLIDFLNWKDDGVIIVPGLLDKSDILKTDGLERARMLGQNM